MKLIKLQLNIESDGIRIGLPVIRELQTIEAKLDELQDKLEKLLDKQQNAIRSEGDYVINGNFYSNIVRINANQIWPVLCRAGECEKFV